MNDSDKITSFLKEEGILDEAAINRLLEQQTLSGKSLINLLKTQNLVDADQLTKVIAKTNNIDFINLSPESIDPVAARLVSYEMSRQHTLIPVKIEKDCLYVAMSSPLNLSVRDLIAAKTGYRVVPLAATNEAVLQSIAYHFNVESATKQDIVEMRLRRQNKEQKKKKARQTHRSADTPIVRLVDSIITGAIDANASDVHLEPQEPDMKVRYRIDGILLDAIEIPSSAQREVISHIKVLAEMDISERRVPQDGHINIDHNGKYYDLRASSLPAVGGEKIVMRILDAESGLKDLDDIVTDEEDNNKFHKIISNPYGMILLTGPTGSGKTTTLYSILQTLNTPERNIVTIEDPVEYRIKGITQVQVQNEIGRTFANGLRSILRQDPDVILIGEIRDTETAEIAVSAALTGHLVLSTLHTNDAAGAVSRLVSLGIPPFQVASSLLGTVAQRLVRVICPNCVQDYPASDEELKLLNQYLDEETHDIHLKKGLGCRACRSTGYRGRNGLYEILNITPALRNMIVQNCSDHEIKKKAIEEGMKTLKMQGINYTLSGKTTLDELLRVVDVRED